MTSYLKENNQGHELFTYREHNMLVGSGTH